MPIIEVENVTKRYRAARGARALLGRGGLAEWLFRRNPGEVVALDDVSFNIEPGESVGIIGANGSGKSTLLKIIAGVTIPSSGTVRVYGRVASLLELGAGFHPMLTGRENVYLNAGIHGMRHAEVEKIFDNIVEFSGVGKFIDYPLSTYSSGMYVRLGFAIAVFTNPDVFLVDEVLAVGDEEFQRRCRARIGELREQGKTVVFVSHDLSIVNTLCERVLLLNKGRMILRDTPRKAIDFYLHQIGQVGRDEGLATLRQDALEVIFSDGRISIFFNQEEVTSAPGLQLQFFYMGRWHPILEATWSVEESTDTSCRARGNYHRLGVQVEYVLSIEDGRLIAEVALVPGKAFRPDAWELRFAFPPAYNRWAYDDATGDFHSIDPDDTLWLSASGVELMCDSALALPEADAPIPAVKIDLASPRDTVRAGWWNSDYFMNSRVLRLEEQIAEDDEALGPGRHVLVNAQFTFFPDPDAAAKEAGARRSRQTVQAGDLAARFDRGRLRLSYRDRLLTTSVHLYTAVFSGNLWNESMNYRWERLRREGPNDEVLIVEGASRRFPVSQTWRICPDDGRLGLEIWLDAHEDITVQECHTSILLRTDYEHWASAKESGRFPGISESDADWAHLNADYSPGGDARVWGPDFPLLTFQPDHERASHRMSILNTSHFENARVLQALRHGEHGLLYFPKGRHLYFAGWVSVTPEGA